MHGVKKTSDERADVFSKVGELPKFRLFLCHERIFLNYGFRIFTQKWGYRPEIHMFKEEL